LIPHRTHQAAGPIREGRWLVPHGSKGAGFQERPHNARPSTQAGDTQPSLQIDAKVGSGTLTLLTKGPASWSDLPMDVTVRAAVPVQVRGRRLGARK